jgi:hypothetical protein
MPWMLESMLEINELGHIEPQASFLEHHQYGHAQDERGKTRRRRKSESTLYPVNTPPTFHVLILSRISISGKFGNFGAILWPRGTQGLHPDD